MFISDSDLGVRNLKMVYKRDSTVHWPRGSLPVIRISEGVEFSLECVRGQAKGSVGVDLIADRIVICHGGFMGYEFALLRRR